MSFTDEKYERIPTVEELLAGKTKEEEEQEKLQELQGKK